MSDRQVFQDVDEKRVAATQAPARVPARRGIFVWLMVLALLVAAMVLVGGATRITESGLSITEWAPILGALPPMSSAEWEAAFEAYQKITEFKEDHSHMTLETFKPIFWWEWGHRLLGRLIGVVWLVGFLAFLIGRRIPEGWTLRLVIPGVLGGLQGAIGWWMVASGVTDEPGVTDVAPYRLAVHLGLAFAIFALLIWYAIRIRHDAVDTLQRRRRRDSGLVAWTNWLGAVVFLQVLLGALVAGLRAGEMYIDWPWMAGRFFPEDAMKHAPSWRNFFESEGLTQFNHRMVAYLIVMLAVLFMIRFARSGHAKIRAWGVRVAVVAIVQAVLGIVTVMNATPLDLALMHQAVALVLVGALVHARFEAAYPSEQKITAG